MKRTINFKAIAILAVIVLGSGMSVHFIHAYQVQCHSRELLELAGAAQRDALPADTAKYLDLYLGFHPNDWDAQARYALTLKELAVSPREKLRAFFILEKVLSRDSGRQDVRRAAAEIGMQFGRFREASSYLE